MHFYKCARNREVKTGAILSAAFFVIVCVRNIINERNVPMQNRQLGADMSIFF